VDIYPLNVFIGFKMEHICVIVVSEGVYEEIYQGLVIRLYFLNKFCLDYMRVNSESI